MKLYWNFFKTSRLNENENTAYQILDKTKAILKGKFIAVGAYAKKSERSESAS
jgi:hypothetical protein